MILDTIDALILYAKYHLDFSQKIKYNIAEQQQK